MAITLKVITKDQAEGRSIVALEGMKPPMFMGERVTDEMQCGACGTALVSGVGLDQFNKTGIGHLPPVLISPGTTNLVVFIRQNNGRLPKKRRAGEFRKLSDDEVTLIEGVVSDAFASF